MSANTPLPKLTWSTVTLVNVAAAPGAPSTVRLVQQDGTQRSFSGTLTFSPAAGVVDGGLDTGTEASNTWYYLYLVPSTGSPTTLAVRGSTTSPTVGAPTGYTNYTYIGAVRNNSSSDLVVFFNTYNRFDYAVYYAFTFEGSPTMGSLVTQALADYVPLTCSHCYYRLTGWPYNFQMHMTFQATASATGWQWNKGGFPGGGLGGNINFQGPSALPTPSTPRNATWWGTLSGGNYQNQTRWVHGYIDGWRR